MPSELPLKIRTDARDLWDSETSAVKSAMKRLATTLGYKFQPEPKWPLLWEELKDSYSDKSTFIPTISRIAVAWYDQFLSRLEDDNYSEWTDQVLELLAKNARDRYLTIEPGTGTLKRPLFTWHSPSNSFVLQIPKTDPGPHAKTLSGFDIDFESLTAPEGAPRKGSGVVEEGWDDVAAALPPKSTPETSTTRSTNISYNTFVSPDQSQKTRRLPSLAEIDRPAQLFATITPSVLTLDVRHNGLVIQSSHERSLELISSYFNKWGVQNRSDSLSRNIWKVELVESTMCSGVMDTITVETYGGNRQPNPTLFLSFIQGVLGYILTYTNGGSWIFKSDAIFKA